MSLTIQQVAQRLLFRIGVVSLNTAVNANSANASGVDLVNDIPEAVNCINGAAQEIWSLGPTCIRESRKSWQLYAPASVTLTVTQYGTTISALSPSQSWMPGCTIRILGDGLDNELVSATELLRPCQAASGSISATVFCDCITMPSTIGNVLSPVHIPTILSPLAPAASREEFQGVNKFYGHHDIRTTDAYYAAQNKVTGEPRIWFAEPSYDPTLSYLQIKLRLNPMPGTFYPITGRVEIKPPTFTSSDVGVFSADPGTQFPQDWMESILLPIAMQRFQTHPNFAASTQQLKEMQRQYDQAFKTLDSMAPMIASVKANYPY